MEAKLKERKSVEATVEVTVPAADVDKAYDRVLRQLSRQVRVPGFRPGKAPRGVLVKRIGKEALEGEVREDLIESSYPQAMKQFELSPVHAHVHGGTPNEGEDFTFELHVDLYPEIELPSLEEIVIDSEGRRVDDEMVAQTVARLQSENATMVPVDRAVQAGDYLLVETVSSEEEGEEAPQAASTMPIDLEEVSDELAEQLIGKSAGEVVKLELAAQPETAESEEGETQPPPTLDIRIKDVKEKEKPEPDDEFAKTLGFDNWQETEARIRESLQAQLDQEALEEQRDEFVDKLMAASTFELPRSLVQRRRIDLLENLTEDLKRRGLTLEKYVEQLDANDGREQFEKELQEAAEKGVRRDLVLERLLEVRGTTISDAEFEAALRQLALQQGMDVERLRRERGEEWLRNYRFLLTRDRALREAVEERLAAQRDEEPTDQDVSEVSGGEEPAEASAGQEAAEVSSDQEATEAGAGQEPVAGAAADGENDPEGAGEPAEERR
ncbi:MAG TPA: trigger factor [Trueperaceae bacterium]